MGEEKSQAGGRPAGKKAGLIFVLIGCLAILLGAGFLISKVLGAKDSGKAEAFESDKGAEFLRYIDLALLTDNFATFELGEDQGLYIAFDTDDTPYIICMSEEEFEKHAEIHAYTLDLEGAKEEAPEPVRIQGYPVELGEKAVGYAIEYANEYLFGEEILTRENFSDYFGTYYLDMTYRPGVDYRDNLITIVCGLFLLVYGIVLLKKNRDGESLSGEPLSGEPVHVGAVLEETPVNHGLGILGALLGSLAGAAVWVAAYQLGYLVGIAGYLSVACAIFCYKKLAKGINRGGVILCAVVSIVMLCLANVAACSLSIVSAVNATNPGRASLGSILPQFSSLMSEYNLWGDFFRDLAFGLFLALAAMWTPLKKMRKMDGSVSES